MAKPATTNVTLAAKSASILRRELEMFVAAAGFKETGSIPENMGFREWCELLASKGLTVDRKPFKLSDRPALIPIYEAIPTTREQAKEQILVIQKSTQIGLTIWEVMADLYMATKWSPVNIGLYLPDQSTASFKSEHRFMPILRSAPELYHELTHRREPDGRMIKVGEGNVMTRQYAQSIMFLWTSGRVSTESRPMDVVSLDEVQEMTLDQIDKVMARTGDSDVAFKLLLSTANIAEADINAWYLKGSQEVWHTKCPNCGDLSDLSDPAGIFPDKSIAYNNGEYPEAPANDYIWTCPHCSAWIRDPQQGEYVVTRPVRDNMHIRSFLLPRTISPRITPRKMYLDWKGAKTGNQKKSFYNRQLARPYIDADQMPVTIAHCEAAAKEGIRRGVVWEKRATPGGYYVMGLDQMAQYTCAVIKKRMPNGMQAVVHVEAIMNDDPFGRSAELMDEFNISVCVLEQNPNATEARRFANLPRLRGRVFLNTGFSANPQADAITWQDQISRSDKRTSEEDRSRYACTISQYKCMQMALYRVRDLTCLFPDPDLLEQDVLDEGRPKRVVILRDMVWDHKTKVALVVEQDEQERKPKLKVIKVSRDDPHFAYAMMLCDIAWSRQQGTGTIIIPDADLLHGPETEHAKTVVESLPGLPTTVVDIIDTLPLSVCGRCSNFNAEKNYCMARSFNTMPRDPSCELYEPVR